MLLQPTGTLSGSSEKRSEQPTESQLIGSLEAKVCRGCFKTGSKVLEAEGKVPGPGARDHSCCGNIGGDLSQ